MHFSAFLALSLGVGAIAGPILMPVSKLFLPTIDREIYTIDTKAAEVNDSDDSQIYTIDTKAADVNDSDDGQIYTIDTKAAEVNDSDDSQIYTIDTKADA
ncbi:hypothetical protein F4678DRAFT_467379 [Xylaria arbuscula]|nr:hypothetical protein F4678DRAFT_467379 [Xylaria arbuscula]